MDMWDFPTVATEAVARSKLGIVQREEGEAAELPSELGNSAEIFLMPFYISFFYCLELKITFGEQQGQDPPCLGYQLFGKSMVRSAHANNQMVVKAVADALHSSTYKQERSVGFLE
ncbi:hypothetical protein IHE44_0000919, partial [Lamprotornis superbus]